MTIDKILIVREKLMSEGRIEEVRAIDEMMMEAEKAIDENSKLKEMLRIRREVH